jgi:hypothetical protein
MKTAYLSRRLRGAGGNAQEAAGWRRLALRFRAHRRDRRMRGAVVVQRDSRVFLTIRPMAWLGLRVTRDVPDPAHRPERASATPVCAIALHAAKRADAAMRMHASRPAPATLLSLVWGRLHRDAWPESELRASVAIHASPGRIADSATKPLHVRARQDDTVSVRARTIRSPDATSGARAALRPMHGVAVPGSYASAPSAGAALRPRAAASANASASAPLRRGSPRRVTQHMTPHDPRLHWASRTASAVRPPVPAASGLVWAQSPRATRPVDATRPVSPDESTARAQSARDSVLQADIVARACEVVRREMLSGVTVERLAEDVIRRIDRRSRIERERRGL